MGDFIELGLEGADKLIDRHFDKVPDKYVHGDTYKPKRLRKGSRDSDQQQQVPPSRKSAHKHHRTRRSPSPPYPQSDPGMADSYTQRNANSSPYLQDGPFVTPPLYSNLPPHQRPEYGPAPPIGANPNAYYQSQPLTHDTRRSTSDDYYSPPRRPTTMRRRSSSYHGPRDDYFSSDSEDGKQLAVRNPRHHKSHTDIARRSSSSHHSHGNGRLEDKVKDQFTNSKEGLAGGVVGAIVGGWATHKALESRGKDRGTGDAALTLLGAAVGGLAVNAMVDKLEDRKEEKREKQEGRSGKGRDRGRRGDDDGYYT